LQLKSRSASADPLEIEADSAADLVTHRLHAPSLQRKCAGDDTCSCSKCSGDEEERKIKNLSATPARIQRQANSSAPEKESGTQSAATHALSNQFLVDDGTASPHSNQMSKSVFLTRVNEIVCATADAELAAAGRSSDQCPYISKWMAFFKDQSASHVERSLLKYAPEALSARSAKDYFPIIQRRVRVAVATWAKTGKVTGLPPGVGAMPDSSAKPSSPADGKQTSTAIAPAEKKEGFAGGLLRSLSTEKRVQFKEMAGTTPNHADPQSIRAQLGSGQGLDSRSRSRMESAFGHDFSRVRIHTDGQAGSLSGQLNARAFTIGTDIAFAPSEYRPGTLLGDALLAHELAHVVQQNSTSATPNGVSKDLSEDTTGERVANLSAIRAVSSFTKGAGWIASLLPTTQVRSSGAGVRLQRCSCKASKDPKLSPLDAARKCFEEENDQLDPAEISKVEAAIKKVASDNSPLAISFYKYYSKHKTEKAGASRMKKWAKSQLAETSPSDDTYLNPSVFDASYSEAELGSLLLHEFVHTRHEENYIGSRDYQEGDAYAAEYFFAERSGAKNRQVQIIKIMSNPQSIAMANQTKALISHFQATYGVLVGLYEIIDKGKSSYPGSPFVTPTSLSQDEAKALVAELISSFPDNRSARLKDILTWVGKNPAKFNSPI
jgi:hypothetical protein